MTKIDFYLLRGEGQNARETMACKLIEKIYHLNHKVYVHADSEEDAKRIDNLLWTQKAGSFLPHEITGNKNYAQTPILIGYGDSTPDFDDVLVNLSHSVPLFFSQFNRVAEFVDTNTEHKKLGRTRFKFYKDRGYALDTHDLPA